MHKNSNFETVTRKACGNILSKKKSTVVSSKEINGALDDIFPRLKFLEEKVAAMTVQLHITNEKQDSLIDRILTLEQKLLTAEKRYKSKNIVKTGIPNNFPIYDIRFMNEICKQLGSDITCEDVSHIERFKLQGSGSETSPVLVSFSKLWIKNLFMSKYLSFIKTKNLNMCCLDRNKTNDLYINDHLTKNDAYIFKIARKMKKEKKISKVSVRKGTVIIKLNNEKNSKFIFINTLEQLKTLESDAASINMNQTIIQMDDLNLSSSSTNEVTAI